jgi:hypothetical protein
VLPPAKQESTVRSFNSIAKPNIAKRRKFAAGLRLAALSFSIFTLGASGALTQGVPALRQAPVGHRQPTLSDLPPDVRKDEQLPSEHRSYGSPCGRRHGIGHEPRGGHPRATTSQPACGPRAPARPIDLWASRAGGRGTSARQVGADRPGPVAAGRASEGRRPTGNEAGGYGRFLAFE